METIKINQDNIHNNQNIIDENSEKYDDIFDVAIIGGGFAGLSAALLLGRYLRPTVIFDVREQRKSLIHGYLGFERTPREELIQKSWENVLQYKSVKKVEEFVQKVEIDTNNNLFLITSEKATETEFEEKDTEKIKDDKNNNTDTKRKSKAKYLIIAPGIKHIKPLNIKNFEQFDGNGIWHCPHCDGFEVTNKTLIIITSNNKKESIDYAKLFLGWTKEITLFRHKLEDENIQDQKSEKYFTDKQKDEAKVLGINIIENDSIDEIISDPKSNIIKGIITKSGKFHKADVIFYHFEQIIQNKIAIQLGCELDEGYLKVNEKQQTTVPNVYAAGDIDTDRHYAVLAAASGALAAISIYEELLKGAIKITKIQ
jgi:thioredoxin reductase